MDATLCVEGGEEEETGKCVWRLVEVRRGSVHAWRGVEDRRGSVCETVLKCQVCTQK